MRKVTTEQFLKNFQKEIQDLPVMVTKYGKDLIIVSLASQLTTPPVKQKVVVLKDIVKPVEKVDSLTKKRGAFNVDDYL